jgi:hypothetical protein
MAEDRIPHSWIGEEVVVETGSNYSPGGGLACTLRDVTPEGIVVSYTAYRDQGGQEETAFYPWSSIYRVLKT